MKKSAVHTCVLLALAISAPAFAEEAQGDWGGVLAGAMRLTAHIAKAPDGSYQTTLGSPDQGPTLMKADSTTATATQLRFSIAQIKGSYAGEWNEKEQAWVGIWTQGGTMPLVLKRQGAKGMAPLVLHRPQEEAIAKAPQPYLEHDVSFSNAKAKVKLAGTLTVPRGKGPFPTVVLVHGSGKHGRDEDIFGHKIFKVLADHLTRQGIAVLRYDKRGAGASTGNGEIATTLDFTTDAEAAVAFLRTRPEVDQRKLGIVGHSEGAMIAPLAASRDPALAFIVLLAGPAVRGDRLLIEQMTLINRADGHSEADLANDRVLKNAVFAALTGPGTAEATKAKAKALYDRAVAKKELPTEQAQGELDAFASPWFRSMLAYDPVPVLRRVKQPVLAINGERDLQVPAKLNLAAIRASLPARKGNEVVELPGLNHLLQTAKSGSPGEYATIEETIAPLALNKVSSWILVQGPAPTGAVKAAGL